jgi:hypothetical protein
VRRLCSALVRLCLPIEYDNDYTTFVRNFSLKPRIFSRSPPQAKNVAMTAAPHSESYVSTKNSFPSGEGGPRVSVVDEGHRTRAPNLRPHPHNEPHRTSSRKLCSHKQAARQSRLFAVGELSLPRWGKVAREA